MTDWIICFYLFYIISTSQAFKKPPPSGRWFFNLKTPCLLTREKEKTQHFLKKNLLWRRLFVKSFLYLCHFLQKDTMFTCFML